MKPNLTEPVTVNSKRLLILSDGKPGHVNQSIAFAKHLGYDYDLSLTSFKFRGAKALSYLLDRLGFYSDFLFNTEMISGDYTAVVSAGSGTYYANRTLAKSLDCKSIAIMLPKGYQLDFDLIIAQQHDDPPLRKNIISIPINLTYVEPQGIVVPQPDEKYIALIIGGDSKKNSMDAAQLEQQVSKIFELFPEHKVWLTTSRRTPEAVEKMLKGFHYERAVYYSQEPLNPIPDYLQHSEYVFLTADSSSMISEAVSFGKSCVEVLPFSESLPENSKFNKLLKILSEEKCLHVFTHQVGHASTKIDLNDVLNGAQL